MPQLSQLNNVPERATANVSLTCSANRNQQASFAKPAGFEREPREGASDGQSSMLTRCFVLLLYVAKFESRSGLHWGSGKRMSQLRKNAVYM